MSRSAIHPGLILADEIAALSMNAKLLAERICVPANRITNILNGKRAITVDTALRLAQFFGTSPTFWINLQTQYDLRLAEMTTAKKIRKEVKSLLQTTVQ